MNSARIKMVKNKSCGSWESPITSSLVADSSIRWGDMAVYDDVIYWSEIRPNEQGRSVVVKWSQGQQVDITPFPYNVRTRVHEYGGGAFTIHRGVLYFIHFEDQNFYSLALDGTIKKIVSVENKRYANPVFDPQDHLIYAIEETRSVEKGVINALVVIDPSKENEVITLSSGCDFYSSITISPDGTQIAFLTWNHPLMPWDGTHLWTAQILPDRSLTRLEKIAGSSSESIFQPRFAPDGTLFFVSDRTGFWNLYEWDSKQSLPCYPLDAEFGSPQWVFGMSRYDFVRVKDGYQIACNYTVKGVDTLALLDLQKYTLKNFSFPFTSYNHIHVAGRSLYFIAASPTQVSTLYHYDLETQSLETIRKSKNIQIDQKYISKPKALEFPTENRQTAFGFYYPPKNKDFTCTTREKPPLIVKSHGGPAAQAAATLSLDIQFWTSRGFAFLDVNYGGSTGYGRAYRERLKKSWGIVDVNDCVNGALYLVKKGLVDPHRLAIRGGSAGGYTVLAALAFRNSFQAGASYFGVSDLTEMTKHTHKFESHYLDSLVGDYPEEKRRYIDYSPIAHIENVTCPVILFQGDEDKIVPKSQSEKMFRSLKAKGIPTSYILFQGEQHGFRKAKTIKKALDAEYYFYSQIFHFALSDRITAIKIENWEPRS